MSCGDWFVTLWRCCEASVEASVPCDGSPDSATWSPVEVRFAARLRRQGVGGAVSVDGGGVHVYGVVVVGYGDGCGDAGTG